MCDQTRGGRQNGPRTAYAHCQAIFETMDINFGHANHGFQPGKLVIGSQYDVKPVMNRYRRITISVQGLGIREPGPQPGWILPVDLSLTRQITFLT